MKRFRRILFNGFAVMSSLVCVVTMVLWVRSIRVNDFFDVDDNHFWIDGDHPDRCLFNGWGFRVMSEAGTIWFEPIHFVEDMPATFLDTLKAGGAQGLSCRFDSTPPPDMALKDYFGGTWWHGFGIEAHRNGFYQQRDSQQKSLSNTGVTVGVPAWFLIVLTSLPPLMAFRRWRRSRYRPGMCPSCSYDLRATPDRCPECGAVPSPAKAKP